MAVTFYQAMDHLVVWYISVASEVTMRTLFGWNGVSTLALVFNSKKIIMSLISNNGHNLAYLGNSLLDFCVARRLPLVIYMQLFTIVMLMFSLVSLFFFLVGSARNGSRTTYIEVHCFMLE